MRIVHTSDWHLGRKLGRIDRSDDLRKAVARVAEVCEREKADVLLICGDIFEQGRAEALRGWVEHLNATFAPFMAGGGTILAITGNHDNENVAQVLQQAMRLASPGSPGHGGGVMPGRFHLFTGPTFFHLVGSDGCKVQFVALPSPTPSRYVKAEEAKAYQGIDERNRALKTAYVATLQGMFNHAKFDKTCPTVLAAHVLTSGIEVREGVKLGDAEGIVVAERELPTHLAYVALGDVHKPTLVQGMEHVRYCGSIERMDLGEAGEEKGVVVVDVGPAGLAGKPRWVAIEATPIQYVEVSNPPAEVAGLAAKYPDRERTLMKLMLRYRAGRDDLNVLLSELDGIFPRWYERDWREVSDGGGEAAGGGGATRHDTVRQTVMEYLQSQLGTDADRDEIVRLAEELVAEQERQ